MKTPKPLVFCFALFFFYIGSAQRAGLVNSGDLLEKGIELNDKGKYKDAIGVFSQISRSDTNYSRALHELSLSSYQDSNFQASLRYAEEGLKLFPDLATDWYGLMASAFDEMENRPKALELYNKIISLDKNNYLAYFNKGITLMRLEKSEEAQLAFQQCVMINPFYVSAHYFLGYLALQQGRIPEAMMSYTASLTISPGNRYYNHAIGVLADIGKMNDDLLEKAAKRKSGNSDDFDLIQELLINKVAFDKKYKLEASLEDPVVRQLQVLLEKLEYNPSDKGFWMQYYVPFFTQVYSTDRFEPFVFHILSNLDIKQVATYVKRNDRRVSSFTDFAAEYFNEIKATRELNSQKRAPVKQRYFYSSNKLVGIGDAQSRGKETILVGPWEFYHSNGQLQAKGKFNDNNERTGIWEFYHSNGQLKEKTNYINGKAEGDSPSWFDNGLPAAEARYKNGELEGLYKEYYYNGILKKSETYKSGTLNGPAKGFTINSTLSYTVTYRDGKENSDVIYYHYNGKVRSSARYVDGEATGRYKEFYFDGKLKSEGNYEKDKKTGIWKEFHQNGKVSTESNYVDDELDGEYRSFFESGKLSAKVPYKKGKVDGTLESYDDDGKMISESYYERDRLKEIKFYDKSGKVISSSTSRNGAGNFSFFGANGNKISDGYYSKEGLQNGKGTYYFRTGKPSVVAEYKDGLLNGMRTEYYRNGQIASEGKYAGNEEDGYHVSYHHNGKTKDEGWIMKGEKQGEHVNYTKLGEVFSRVNYLNDQQQGYTEYYHPNGRIDYEQRFDEGWVKQITQFDTTGNIIMQADFPKGSGNFEFRLYNGKPYIKASYSNNYLNGEHRSFYPDGSTSAVQYYRYGLSDSIYRSFHFGGKPAVEGRYTFGNKQGEWKFYHDDGSLSYVETYVDGLAQGRTKMYNEDGTLDKEIDYKDGELHGAYRVYGDNNQLAVEYHYKNGDMISYTYEGKDGKMVPSISLVNGTGEIRGYYKDGRKSIELNIVDNEGQGVRKLYFTNGKTYVEVNRVDGFEHGNKKIYYPSGQVEKDENYFYGNLHGTVTMYYANGKLKSQEKYYNGDLHGECRYFDSAGKVQVRTYFYGVMQTVK